MAFTSRTRACRLGYIVPVAQRQAAAPAIRFNARLVQIEKATVVRLPKEASARLPSRGQVAAVATLNGHEFETVVEPDGRFGHWLKIDSKLQRAAGVHKGDPATVELTPTKRWPEPKVPGDLEAALAAAPQKIRDIWRDITPMARWEWVRWVNATANPDTRKRRVEVSISKMDHGKRRPCCFDLASCTDPELARNGTLRDPSA